MPDIVYKNVPYGNGTIVIKDSWPEGIRDMWLAALAPYSPEKPRYVPTFEAGPAFSESPQSPPMPLNMRDYATEATADEMARRFGAQVVSIGLAYSTTRQRWLVWPDGTAVIAGALAQFFVSLPEDQDPGQAELQCWRTIAGRRIMGLKLPPSVEPIIQNAEPKV